MIILSIFTFILFVFVIFLIHKQIQLMRVVIDLDEKIEEALDILEVSYQEITKATMTEVFSDEPLVRKVVTAIKNAQISVVNVQKKLVAFNGLNTNDKVTND